MSDRTRSDTRQELVPAIEIDRRIERAKETLRREWISTIDRQALERAADEAREAARKAEAAAAANLESRAVSLRRFHRLIAAHVFTFIALVAMAGIIGMGWAYAQMNRERIELLERAGR